MIKPEPKKCDKCKPQYLGQPCPNCDKPTHESKSMTPEKIFTRTEERKWKLKDL